MSTLHTNPYIPVWIKRASESYQAIADLKIPFNISYFSECLTTTILMSCIRCNTYPIGRTFYYGNLCFINIGKTESYWVVYQKEKLISVVAVSEILRDIQKGEINLNTNSVDITTDRNRLNTFSIIHYIYAS